MIALDGIDYKVFFMTQLCFLRCSFRPLPILVMIVWRLHFGQPSEGAKVRQYPNELHIMLINYKFDVVPSVLL